MRGRRDVRAPGGGGYRAVQPGWARKESHSNRPVGEKQELLWARRGHVRGDRGECGTAGDSDPIGSPHLVLATQSH